jgi:hypothetical protein
MTMTKYGRFWAVWNRDGGLVCVTVYRKGAQEVLRRLQAQEPGPGAAAVAVPARQRGRPHPVVGGR